MRYLITQEQLEYLTSVNSHIADELLASLKPIEPLSDEAIDDAVVGMGLMPTRYDRELSRAIEEHILGEKHEALP